MTINSFANASGATTGKESVTSFRASTPAGYKFNLPPHNWSLPADPVRVDTSVPGKPRRRISNNDSRSYLLTRGRIWRYAPLSSMLESPTSATDTSNYLKDSYSYFRKYNRVDPKPTFTQNTIKQREDEKYGFQFLWNPTEYASSVGMTANVVPAASDTLSFLNMFQGTGTIQLQLQINRINDFACFKSVSTSDFNSFYGPMYTTVSSSEKSLMVQDLRNRGTLADLEFLYKTINGPYLKSQTGIETSDVGILIPTLVRIDIGPYSQVGLINQLEIKHSMFTQAMIPILSTVTISIGLLSSYGFGNTSANNPNQVLIPPQLPNGTRPKLSNAKARQLERSGKL